MDDGILGGQVTCFEALVEQCEKEGINPNEYTFYIHGRSTAEHPEESFSFAIVASVTCRPINFWHGGHQSRPDI